MFCKYCTLVKCILYLWKRENLCVPYEKRWRYLDHINSPLSITLFKGALNFFNKFTKHTHVMQLKQDVIKNKKDKLQLVIKLLLHFFFLFLMLPRSTTTTNICFHYQLQTKANQYHCHTLTACLLNLHKLSKEGCPFYELELRFFFLARSLY